MTTEALKSTSITNKDANPIVLVDSGQGAPGILRQVEDYVSPTTGKTSGSTYRVLRLPSSAVMKTLHWWIEASSTTSTFDVDIAYSDGIDDPSYNAQAGAIIQVSSADNKVFGAAIDMHTAAAPADLVYAIMTGASFNTPLWALSGLGPLASDPMCMFDIVLKNTATNSGTAVIHLRATYVSPA
jgi:hypothetical protein